MKYSGKKSRTPNSGLTKSSILGLIGGACYALVGQQSVVAGEPMKDGKPTKLTPANSKLEAEFNAMTKQCNSRSLIDRFRNDRSGLNSKFSSERKALFFVGNDTCPGRPIPAGTSFTDTGTTVGANNTVTSVQAGCSNYTTNAGPDVIYRFTLPALAQRIPTCTIDLTPTTATYDPSIYTLSSTACPNGTANPATNCVNGADAGLAGDPEQITDAEMDAMPAGTYFLFIDSFYSTAAGSGGYTLNFNCTTLAPTAAGVTVSGRVLGEDGRGLANANVTITDQVGNARVMITGGKGAFSFPDVQPGQTYTVSVGSKRYNFAPRIVEITDDISDLNFTPDGSR